MAVSLKLFKLSALFSLLSSAGLWSETSNNKGGVPPTCTRIECPSYDVVQLGNGYEIRSYNSSVWMSTAPIEDISLVEATRTGFFQLFEYIQGKNADEQQIEMTGPVITEVFPSDGPFCESSFTVSFYVPKENQADPPSAKGLHAQRWTPQYAAVRQFSGFVTDYNVGEEAAALQASLGGTKWATAIEKRHAGADDAATAVYIVAQYNSPFEFEKRVNEIWMVFDMEDELACHAALEAAGQRHCRSYPSYGLK